MGEYLSLLLISIKFISQKEFANKFIAYIMYFVFPEGLE